MIIHRSNFNAKGAATTTGERLAAMQRHDEQTRAVRIPISVVGAPPTGGGGPPDAPAATPPLAPGDTVYGARRIARYLFEDDSDQARRRVFCLWAHYRDRNEDAGFFKLKGALCLSKSKWKRFHGL